MKVKNEKICIELCDYCNVTQLHAKNQIAERQCLFCKKWLCHDCIKNIKYNSYLPVCRTCMNYLEKTKGEDLQKLGFQCKYDCITDKDSIADAIQVITEDYRKKGIDAISKFLSELYEEAKRRHAKAELNSRQLEKLNKLKKELKRQEIEIEEKKKKILYETPEDLPF